MGFLVKYLGNKKKVCNDRQKGHTPDEFMKIWFSELCGQMLNVN